MRLRDWSSDVCSSDHQRRHRWPGLKTVVMLESTREIGVKIEHETRLYISSLALQAERFGAIVRSHWAIENSLHWVIEMVFRDDECRLRTDHAPAAFPTNQHISPHPIGKAQCRKTVRQST